MKVEIVCSRCNGYGEVMERERLIDSDGSEDIGATPHIEVCSRCKGEGVSSIEVKSASLLDKCPNCNKLFSIDRVFNIVKEILLGHTRDLTHWLDDKCVITIDARNTRFVEKTLPNGNRIEVFNTFFEKDRLGNYHGYWMKDDVKKIVKYLQDWLVRNDEKA